MVRWLFVVCRENLVNAQSEDLVFQEDTTVRIHQEEYRCHLDKCHINPAIGGVFDYNISIERKNFRRMKLLTKIVLSLMAYNYAKSGLQNVDVPHVGRRSAGRINPPINDGGL